MEQYSDLQQLIGLAALMAAMGKVNAAQQFSRQAAELAHELAAVEVVDIRGR